jgi:predicted transcriptional regulator
MHIDLTPEQEARIVALASRDGKNLRDVMTDTAVWLLEMDAAHDAALTHSIAQADRGEFIEEEEMDRRFARMMQTK